MEDMTARLKQSNILAKKHICETHILPFFGKKPINNQLTCMINYAKHFYDLNTNPCGQAGSIGKVQADEMDYRTYDEYIAFREGIKDKPLAYICFQVLYRTGMREGELLALTAADIDLVAKQIDINKTYQRLHGEDIITTPKAKKSKRKVPIPDFLCQELVNNLEQLAASVPVTPTLEPPTGNPLLETMGISYDDDTANSSVASETTYAGTELPYGPMPKESAS